MVKPEAGVGHFHCFGQLNVDLNKSFTIVINYH